MASQKKKGPKSSELLWNLFKWICSTLQIQVELGDNSDSWEIWRGKDMNWRPAKDDVNRDEN